MLLKDFARVSEIVTCLNCPRKLYFNLKDSDEKEIIKYTPYIAHLFLRELNLHIPDIIKQHGGHCLLDELKNTLERIEGEIRLIYRNDLINAEEAEFNLAKSEAEAYLPGIASGIKASQERYGRERHLRLITPWKLEQEMRSQKQMLVGRLDRIVRVENEIIPCIIKTGKPPEYGAWQSDRVQLAAYSILAEESYCAVIKQGLVEYARSGILREVVIKHSDRRKVLRIRDEVLKIKKGILPQRIESSECSYCTYRAKCETRVSLASRFFENIL